MKTPEQWLDEAAKRGDQTQPAGTIKWIEAIQEDARKAAKNERNAWREAAEAYHRFYNSPDKTEFNFAEINKLGKLAESAFAKAKELSK
jgi:hypothetical protein